MKLNLYPQNRSNHGSVLFVVLGTIVILGIVLAAVLGLTTQENRILTRTSAWNGALPLAEAGIEEAMSHLRQVNGGNRAVNGWAASGSSFSLTRTNLSEGRFVVAISSAATPVIMSVGQVWCASAGQYIDRRIQVTTEAVGNFQNGLIARKTINFGGQFMTDSFDSGDPDHSTAGQYDPAKAKDHGDVASNMSAPGAIDLSGQVKIYGSVATGAGGTVTLGSGNSVGTASYINSGGTGIQSDPNHYTKDMNVSFPVVESPFTGVGLTPPQNVTVNGVLYKYVLGSGNYSLSTLKLSASDMVLVAGTATLLVNKDVSIGGSAFVQIKPGANLQLYVKSGDVSMTGGGILNQTGYAANFGLWGMPGMTHIKITGGGELIGTMYAPQASLDLSGGGAGILNFVGAGIFDSIKGGGHILFHYDEALAHTVPKNLIITSWKEI